MNNLIKKIMFVIGATFLGLLLLEAPLFFNWNADDLISITSLYFTIFQTIATVVTLIMVLIVYDRFGIKSKFISKQTDKVLELVDILRGLSFLAEGEHGTYFIRASRSRMKSFENIQGYVKDSKIKILRQPESYMSSVKNLISAGDSYWLPLEIKEKIKPFDIWGTESVNETLNKDKKIKLRVKYASSNEDWLHVYPELTLQDFNDNLSAVIEEIDKWLKKHSDVKIDFFDEHR